MTEIMELQCLQVRNKHPFVLREYFRCSTFLDSPHRKKINEAILTIQEQGSLQLFKKRWWQDFENYQQCSKGVSTDTTAESLDVKNIGGLFILLVSGLCLAIVVAFVERHFQKRHEIVI